ncbi:InlB B-repeat-containing protein, partial [Chitinivibrio alkaliphilus]|uniref:InlB B-repeat-containing protein n=1 Tax=Chitinivibrio alkaliphilus TaxID=1505232 RepID=UPI00054D3E3E
NGDVLVDPDADEYEHGSEVTLTAEAEDGYVFVGWSGDVTGSANPLTITVERDMEIIAVFEEEGVERYVLELNAENGSITVDPNFNDYAYGTVVELTAEPNEVYEFTQWRGDAEGDENPLTITVERNMVIEAEFSLKRYELTLTAENGDITADPDLEEYEHGSEVTLTAEAADGYVFVGWSGDTSDSKNPLTITVERDMDIVAVFDEAGVERYVLELNAENGSIKAYPDYIDYPSGTKVLLIVEADTGFEFTQWSGDAEGEDNPLEITVERDMVIEAEFSLKRYSLDITAENGDVSVAPDADEYEHGRDVTLTAEAEDGYVFVGWSGDVTGSANPFTITVERDMEIIAVFEEEGVEYYTLTLDAENGSITANPAFDEYPSGTEVTLRAEADTGYEFTRWRGDTSGSANPLTIIVEDDMDIEAEFTQGTFFIAFDSDGGSEVDTITQQYGTEITAPDDPIKEGHTFDGWYPAVPDSMP